MYSSGYSHVSKYSLQAKKKMKHHSKGKSCGYYMRIVFFFSSLIQSLIIISLVLFLIYGKDQDSASTTRIHDLEESHSRLSIENVALRQQRKNLTTFLNATLIEKARNDWDLAKLRDYINVSIILIQDMDKRLMQCNGELTTLKIQGRILNQCQPGTQTTQCNCGLLMNQLRAKLQLEESNFTQTVQRMRMDMEQIAKERDNINLEAIRLRREKSTHEKEVEYFRQKCKDDFTQSLSGVSSVSSAFLEKIDSLFPSHIAFQLTCPKQREHLEQIRTNCSSLSREVEDRFQRYLNSVGDQVSSIQAESSRMKAENWRLTEDYRWCSQNRTGLIQQNRQNQDKLQLKHDEEKEKLLTDKWKLHGDIEVLEKSVNYKSKEVEHLLEQIKVINMSCMTKTGLNPFPGSTLQGLSGFVSSPGLSQFNKPASGSGSGLSSSIGSFGSAFNKPVSNGAGSSSSSNHGSSSSTGFGYNKPASTGSGSSSSSSSSNLGSSSSTGFGYNKPASTGSGSSSSSGSSLFGSSSSTGFGSSKPASSGSGSSSSSGSSLFGSSSSTGLGSSKPASTGSGSSSSSSSSLFGSSSSTRLGSNKPASTGSGSSSSSSSSLFGSSSSTGVGSNKPASTGSGSSSSSLFGSSSSTGSGSSKPASTGGLFSSSSSSSSGRGSSTSGSSPNLSLGGLGSYNPTSTGKSSSGVGSSSAGSSGSTGLTSKSSPSSSGLGWFGFGGSSSGQSKTGSGTGKETSGGSGSSFGSGRTSSFVGGSVNVAQHLRDLQRIINPAVPEEKQDLSRMLG